MGICLSILWHENLLRIESPSTDFSRVQIFQLLNACNRSVSFPDASRIQRISNGDTWKDPFSPKWWSLVWTSAEIG